MCPHTFRHHPFPFNTTLVQVRTQRVTTAQQSRVYLDVITQPVGVLDVTVRQSPIASPRQTSINIREPLATFVIKHVVSETPLSTPQRLVPIQFLTLSRILGDDQKAVVSIAIEVLNSGDPTAALVRLTNRLRLGLQSEVGLQHSPVILVSATARLQTTPVAVVLTKTRIIGCRPVIPVIELATVRNRLRITSPGVTDTVQRELFIRQPGSRRRRSQLINARHPRHAAVRHPARNRRDCRQPPPRPVPDHVVMSRRTALQETRAAVLDIRLHLLEVDIGPYDVIGNKVLIPTLLGRQARIRPITDDRPVIRQAKLKPR